MMVNFTRAEAEAAFAALRDAARGDGTTPLASAEKKIDLALGLRPQTVHELGHLTRAPGLALGDHVTITGDRTDLVQVIAVELDKPSIYMGGPSPRSRQVAEEVMRRLDLRAASALPSTAPERERES